MRTLESLHADVTPDAHTFDERKKRLTASRDAVRNMQQELYSFKFIADVIPDEILELLQQNS